jgi:hypothetical protein
MIRNYNEGYSTKSIHDRNNFSRVFKSLATIYPAYLMSCQSHSPYAAVDDNAIGISRIVSDKVDFNGFKRHYVDDILLQTAGVLVPNSRDLERMTVQMKRMLIAASVMKDKTIPLTLTDYQRIRVGPDLLLIVMCRTSIRASANVAKRQNKRFVGLGTAVVTNCVWVPFRRHSILQIGFFQHTQRRRPVPSGGLSVDPNIHTPGASTYDCVDTLCNCQRDNLYRLDLTECHPYNTEGVS